MDYEMDYQTVKYLHMSCVLLSGSLFVLRGIWMMRDSALRERLWVRVVPHCVDTVLLGSAVTLAIMSAQYPFQQNWLTAKLVALVIYIVLGAIALKRGTSKPIRVMAWLAALIVFGYIVAVAITKHVSVF
ncbi:putative membrane protein SirB2 [Oxalobacteraceae bacterium GrIS 1.18]